MTDMSPVDVLYRLRDEAHTNAKTREKEISRIDTQIKELTKERHTWESERKRFDAYADLCERSAELLAASTLFPTYSSCLDPETATALLKGHTDD